MGIIGKDYKYKIIENFLTKEEIELFKNYCEIKHRLNNKNFDTEQSNTMDTCFYGDPIMDSLLLSKQKIMEKESGKKLLPTYAFWRTYTKYAILKKHTDRPSCEISATVFIDSEGPEWPIFIEGKELILKPGQAVIYLGCELEHWREEFLGDYQFQTFLHYVDKDGSNKEWYMDKKIYWGMNKN
tara:strand:- start:265 stop:816 length:552 start_codon:yes stop_codon:yes gene_type:complete